MCWLSCQVPVRKKAKRNIPIFKVCRLGGIYITSAYEAYPYTLNKRYNCNFHVNPIKVDAERWEINLGFHSYNSELCTSTNVITVLLNSTVLDIYPDTKTSKFVRVNGYIPQGSYYYENANGEIVSDSIVLTEIVSKFTWWESFKEMIKKCVGRLRKYLKN